MCVCVCVCVKRRRRGGCGQLAQDALSKFSNVRVISWPFLSEKFAFFSAQSPFLTELSRKQHLAGTCCHWTRGYNLSHFQSHSFVAGAFGILHCRCCYQHQHTDSSHTCSLTGLEVRKVFITASTRKFY